MGIFDGIKSYFRELGKLQNIDLYLMRLGPLLARRFGNSDFYTPEQVRVSVREGGLPRTDIRYALAIYCRRKDIEADVDVPDDFDYDKLRAEVADQHFHGNTAFTQSDVSAHVESHSHGGFGDGHHGGDGGGGHGGGEGGGDGGGSGH